MATNIDFLIDVLIDMGYLTEDQVAEARAEADSNGEDVLTVLLKRGDIDHAAIAQAKAAYFNVEFVELKQIQIPEEVISAVPRHIAKKYKAIPVRIEGDAIVVAVEDPSNLEVLDGLQAATGRQIIPAVAIPQDIDAAIQKYYAVRDDQVSKLIQDITEGEVDIGVVQSLSVDDGSVVDADAPIIKLVNTMIVEAFKMRASDIHLEPLANRFRVRYRIDGILHEMKAPPKRLQGAVISRLKIMANMDIAEKRLPQDGRIQINISGKNIDLRVSCIPTTHGESIVMRILDKEGLKLGLSELGFFVDDQQTFEKLISLPDGLLLITGPTGSGKTTTLYAVLNFLNRPDRKIITVEDPVEYILSGINQVQVNEAVGLTFARALRAILRQAPNIIMIGEIRDPETATIAINASLTGHLVFSTLHTNDAPSAIPRLIDIGVKPFLVASACRAVMAQRLVRRVCKKCAQSYIPSSSELKALNINPEQAKGAKFLKGKGCHECNKTGYRGRMGIFEIFVVDDEIRQLIYEKASATVLRARAREMGMRTLREDGARKVLAGLTTTQEVMRVTVMDID